MEGKVHQVNKKPEPQKGSKSYSLSAGICKGSVSYPAVKKKCNEGQSLAQEK